MGRDWFLYIDGGEEGPFYIEELLDDSRLDLQTLVWREGLKDWTPLGEIKELAKRWKAHRKKKRGKSSPKYATKPEKSELPDDEVLAIRSDPPPYLLWIVLVVLVLIYVLIRFV